MARKDGMLKSLFLLAAEINVTKGSAKGQCSAAYGTIYRITDGLPECRNKYFEEGFSKDLQN
jgi:hypothetical protein